jgi:hypothetical protein
MVNGVDDAGAGLLATGTTVTAVGTVPPNFRVVAGKEALEGIINPVSPDEIVATCEFGAEPEEVVTKGNLVTVPLLFAA